MSTFSVSSWLAGLAPAALWATRRLDAEAAHHLILEGLKLTQRAPGPTAAPWPAERYRQRLGMSLLGHDFAAPLGVAAGFDKNAEVPLALARLGAGFCEVGTVTLRAQPGNPPPRIFRLVEDRAVINRYGFNSQGARAVTARLRALRGAVPGLPPLLVNLGINKDTETVEADLEALVARLAPLADLLTLNVSSPNTPGLRLLQEPEAIARLCTLVRRQAETAAGRPVPLLVKLAPDFADEDAFAATVRAAVAGGAGALILTNTTLARPADLKSPHADETGGLSGAPLQVLATQRLAAAYRLVGAEVPLIGVGGIDGPAAAYARIRAGASLLQLYTALVYQGPGLIRHILDGLVDRLDRDRLEHLRDAVGLDAARYAAPGAL